MGDIRMIDGFYDEDTGNLSITQQEYIGDIIEQNLSKQRDGSNGWTKDRMFRHVASIPCSVAAMERIRAMKDDAQHLELQRILNKHPEFKTVDKMLHVGPADGHILIK